MNTAISHRPDGSYTLTFRPSYGGVMTLVMPKGDPLRCRSIAHDICVVDEDGAHHTFDRYNPDRGVVTTGGIPDAE